MVCVGVCVCGPFWSYGFLGECIERFRFGQLPLSSRSKVSSHLTLTVILKDSYNYPSFTNE